MNRRDLRANLLAKLRRQTAPGDDPISDRSAPRASAAAGGPESQQAPDPPRPPAAVPAPLPRRQSDRAGRQRRNPPRAQRPDEQVLAHLARVLPRL